MNWQYLVCYMIVDVLCLVLAGAIVVNVKDDSGSELQVRYFRRLVYSYFGFVGTDALWALLLVGNVAPDGSPVMLGLSALNKVAVVFSAYYWFCYGESRLDSPLVYDDRVRKLAMIPLFAVPVMYVVGAATGLNYTSSADGSVSNGVMYTLITVVGMLYLVAVTVDSFSHFRKAESRAHRRTYLMLVLFMVAPAFGAVFDIFVPYMPVMAPAMLVSIMFVFLSFQESRISSDALTGLNNRRRADEFLEECLGRLDGAHTLYLFIIDMNRFKTINDTYGHLEGDHALQLMAAALRKSSAELDSFAARWGGDEFVMICPNGVLGDPERVGRVIQAHLTEEATGDNVVYDLSCSVGYAHCSVPVAMDELVTAADQSLYDHKSTRPAVVGVSQ